MSTDRWQTEKPPILHDDTAVGFYANPPISAPSPEVFYVRRNRAGTARYAQIVQRMSRRGEHVLELCYRGQMPLNDLTADHALPVASALRLFAGAGPYDACMFCRHSLTTEPLERAFGMSINCAGRHLGVSRRFLRVLYSRLDPPPDGGTPLTRPQPSSAPAERHLRLVAVNGQRVAA